MMVNIKYTIECGGVLEPMYLIHDNGERVTEVLTWLTNSLSLGFSSIEDIDKAIASLQALKQNVINHMNVTKHQFVPHEYQTNGKPIIDISIHEYTNAETTTVRFKRLPLDIVTIRQGGSEDFDHQSVSIYLRAGEAEKLGKKIISSVVDRDNGEDV